MGEFQLRLTSQAARDLREIVSYIAHNNPAALSGLFRYLQGIFGPVIGNLETKEIVDRLHRF